MKFKELLKTPFRRALLLTWLCCTLGVLALNVHTFGQDAPTTTSAPVTTEAPKNDPSGGSIGTASNAVNSGGAAFSEDELAALDANKDKPATNGDLKKALDAIGQASLSINVVWLLITGFMVMFMQAGFAMVETGFCRAKSAAHVIMTNFMIYPIGMLGFWIAGFALMFGSVAATKIGGPGALGGLPGLDGAPMFIPGTNFSFAGTSGFFLSGQSYDVIIYSFFLFQMVFMDTTATIPTGAMAERWRFPAFIVYGFFVSMLAYPIYGHMVWGGGGLAMLGQNLGLGHGAVDFAGSSVVHAVGGFIALAGAIVIGPRIGKFNKDGSSNAMPGHHIPMAIIGTFILAFGWFGFNAGSMLGATGGGNLRIGIIATNTMLASAGGALSAMLYWKMKTDKFDPGMMANGLLAGLVAITAPCAFISSWAAVVIGLIAGVLVILSIGFVEKKRIDDPVGAVSVHGVCGIFGLLCVGIFADGSYGAGWNGVGASDYLGKPGLGVTGLLFGDSKQFLAQLFAAVVCMAWSFGTAYVFFKVQNKFMKLRPSAEDEVAGLDIPEMGALAYPEFKGAPGSAVVETERETVLA